MIHVCYGLYDKDGRYSKFTATSMLSVFENVNYPPPSVIVHILHDNTLTPENRDKFNQIAGRYGQIVKFYNVEQICPNKLDVIKNMMKNASMFERFSIGTAFRLLITYLLPQDIEKVIYLDSDIIVNLDVAEFWQVDIRNKPLASVATWDLGINREQWYNAHYLVTSGLISSRDYFCAATLLLNLDYLRGDEAHFLAGLDFVSKNTNCNFFDQDVLNYCYAQNYVKVSEKFDCYVLFERRDPRKASKLRPAIYHYVSQSLGLDTHDVFNKLFWKYFVRTPFFDEEFIGHLNEGVNDLYNRQKKFAITVSEKISGKERAFFVPPNGVEFLRKLFNIKQNEEIIPATSGAALQNVADSIRNSGGRKIFFILVNPFQAIHEALTRAGFVSGTDFVNGFDFLSGEEGAPLDTYSVVKFL